MKKLIDLIITQKAQGNSFQELNYTMKLMLKGIPVKNITNDTPNDPIILERIYQAAREFNVNIPPH
ncbi:MAG: hypothetical protein ACKO96_13295 [Flammeovirgaceae bacterium]